MTKRSIELKKQYVGFDSFYEAKAIQEEATRVREEAEERLTKYQEKQAEKEQNRKEEDKLL